MNSVVVKYRPWWSPFFINIKRDIANKWSEISGELMVTITKYYNRAISEDMLLSELFKIKFRIVKKLPDYYKYKLFELFDFISEMEPSKEFNVKNIGRLKAPKSGLKGVSFGRFIYGDTYFQEYLKEGGEDHLNRFIAAFYGGKDFDEDCVDELVEEIKTIPLESRESVAINYIMIKKWLCEKYTYIFKNKNEETEKKPSAGKIKNVGGWVNIFDAIVGDDIVNRDRYAELPVNEALRFLNNRIKINRRNGN